MLDKIKGVGLPLTSLNHISFVCSSVEKSVAFYQNVLGFIPTSRPESFSFNGAWLFNYTYGFGIHLLESRELSILPKKREINPKDNHISFQCESMVIVENKLKEMGIHYIQRRVEAEGGIHVDQIFFHDPDGCMIEICNCENLPVIPLAVGDEGVKFCKGVTGAMKQPPQQMVQCLEVATVHAKGEPHIQCVEG